MSRYLTYLRFRVRLTRQSKSQKGSGNVSKVKSKVNTLPTLIVGDSWRRFLIPTLGPPLGPPLSGRAFSLLVGSASNREGCVTAYD